MQGLVASYVFMYLLLDSWKKKNKKLKVLSSWFEKGTFYYKPKEHLVSYSHRAEKIQSKGWLTPEVVESPSQLNSLPDVKVYWW